MRARERGKCLRIECRISVDPDRGVMMLRSEWGGEGKERWLWCWRDGVMEVSMLGEIN